MQADCESQSRMRGLLDAAQPFGVDNLVTIKAIDKYPLIVCYADASAILQEQDQR